MQLIQQYAPKPGQQGAVSSQQAATAAAAAAKLNGLAAIQSTMGGATGTLTAPLQPPTASSSSSSRRGGSSSTSTAAAAPTATAAAAAAATDDGIELAEAVIKKAEQLRQDYKAWAANKPLGRAPASLMAATQASDCRSVMETVALLFFVERLAISAAGVLTAEETQQAHETMIKLAVQYLQSGVLIGSQQLLVLQMPRLLRHLGAGELTPPAVRVWREVLAAAWQQARLQLQQQAAANSQQQQEEAAAAAGSDDDAASEVSVLRIRGGWGGSSNASASDVAVASDVEVPQHGQQQQGQDEGAADSSSWGVPSPPPMSPASAADGCPVSPLAEFGRRNGRGVHGDCADEDFLAAAAGYQALDGGGKGSVAAVAASLRGSDGTLDSPLGSWSSEWEHITAVQAEVLRMLDTLQHYWQGLTTDREQFLSERQQHMQPSPPMFLYRGELSEVSGHFREMDIDAAAAWVELAIAVAEAWRKDRDVVRQWDRYGERELCNCCQLMCDLTSLRRPSCCLMPSDYPIFH